MVAKRCVGWCLPLLISCVLAEPVLGATSAELAVDAWLGSGLARDGGPADTAAAVQLLLILVSLAVFFCIASDRVLVARRGMGDSCFRNLSWLGGFNSCCRNRRYGSTVPVWLLISAAQTLTLVRFVSMVTAVGDPRTYSAGELAPGDIIDRFASRVLAQSSPGWSVSPACLVRV
jgi:hypothetical protein